MGGVLKHAPTPGYCAKGFHREITGKIEFCNILKILLLRFPSNRDRLHTTLGEESTEIKFPLTFFDSLMLFRIYGHDIKSTKAVL